MTMTIYPGQSEELGFGASLDVILVRHGAVCVRFYYCMAKGDSSARLG
jgi:hypothetical protein